VSLGDGVGDGDNDSEGVEPLECYIQGKTCHKRKEHVLVIPRVKASGAPASCTTAGGAGASAQ
jgi:hypothetical protein